MYREVVKTDSKSRSDDSDNNHDFVNVHLGDIEIIDMVKVAARANF